MKRPMTIFAALFGALAITQACTENVITKPHYSTVFQSGKDGYNLYRIPSVTTLPSGRVLAFIEARKNGKTDCAQNDIAMKYSDNEGIDWSDMIMVAEAGSASLNNPTSVYLAEKNRVIVLFQQYPPKTYEGNISTGMDGNMIARTFVSYSDDEGKTWSAKKDITKQVKIPSAAAYATGPGAAIRVITGPDKGRILVPANVAGSDCGWYNYLIASDDLGETWKIIPGHSMYGTNESQIVQISDTTFLINARCHRFEGDEETAPKDWNPWDVNKTVNCRAYIPIDISGDKAEWHKTELRKDLPDPLCQGAIYRYSGLEGNEKSRLIFVNSNSREPICDAEGNIMPGSLQRKNGTIRVSYDDGETWKYSKCIRDNKNTEFQYSVLTRMKSGKIGCLFESGGNVIFARIDLGWLTDGADFGN